MTFLEQEILHDMIDDIDHDVIYDDDGNDICNVLNLPEDEDIISLTKKEDENE